ncbi:MULTISPECIES: DUF6957 family protein [unclassified Pseudomonas]|uniref:DUF6957 family protein n=1 Tax=unclassified Pseudomonas TaxID=196821 RepID=UPI002B22FD34|nr:hypothetical protein [Pseudomonas sp. RTB2]MEB0007895.1 hypothetical protein [Pseudomonas sp. RTB2]MEB0018009.1 hypothetical protein [Pseudomonas sp. RTB3]
MSDLNTTSITTSFHGGNHCFCEPIGKILEDELIGELLFGPAWMLSGSALSDEQLIRATSETFPGRSFCIVKVWMLIDVMLTDRHAQLVKNDGLISTVLYANTIIYAVDAQGDTSHGVLSGFQRSHEDCFFETEDMIYILGGRGARKQAGVAEVFALAQKCGAELWRGYD